DGRGRGRDPDRDRQPAHHAGGHRRHPGYHGVMAQPEPQAAPGRVLVMKFGGTSVADAAKIGGAAARVAAHLAGRRVVGVVSAMGHTTDQLVELAEQVSPRPHPREMDMLLSTGERITAALCAMAINDLGHHAVSLTGSQAGIVTDTVHTKAK